MTHAILKYKIHYYVRLALFHSKSFMQEVLVHFYFWKLNTLFFLFLKMVLTNERKKENEVTIEDKRLKTIDAG